MVHGVWCMVHNELFIFHNNRIINEYASVNRVIYQPELFPPTMHADKHGHNKGLDNHGARIVIL